ncbi:MAG: histidine kinase dimerization/phospho-acceptor domain-containing protein [Gemmatimonadota bacterium]
MLATVCVLLVVTLQARNAEEALDEAAGHTLRDYTGYAGRMLGADVLRRFAEQRATILAPIAGSSRRRVPAPTLADIVRLGDAYFARELTVSDSGIGYFRIDTRTGAIEGTGRVKGELATLLADTLRVVSSRGPLDAPDVLSILNRDGGLSVAYARLLDQDGKVVGIYGYTYTRSRGIAAIADRAFKETPLLPISVAGARWNYDTTAVARGEVVNDSFLGVRISDRAGRVLWASPRSEFIVSSSYRQRVVLSTSAGGIMVETALRPSSESLLIPTIVRNAQRWSMRALIGLTILLAAVSLLALRGERAGARARRTEAMQQLALGLRHEINNALASVMLNAELLAEEESLDESQRERMVAIIEQLDRMRGVLRRLEKTDRFDVVVPYLNEGYMVDLST